MSRHRWTWLGIRFLCLALLVIGLVDCERDQAKTVDLSKRAPLPTGHPQSRHPRLNFGIGSILTPEQGYSYYRQLIDYLSEQLSLDIAAVDPASYQKLNQLLETGKIDIAFVCSGPYVEGHARFGLLLLAAPVVNGAMEYYSNLIVPAKSSISTFADLRGKTFAFTDPQSNSGSLVPKTELARMGFTPETFFDSFTYTYAHDRSIHAVADQLVDGASVDSLIWDYLALTEPELRKQVRIVRRYGPYGIPPLVAAPHVAPELRKKIQLALLTMHENPKGQAILKGMHIDRFEKIDDQAYDLIRQMLNQNRSRFH